MSRLLPTPDVAVVDPTTGLMTRDWYDFFRGTVDVVALQWPPQPTAPVVLSVDTKKGDSFRVIVADNRAITIAAPANAIAGQQLTYTFTNQVTPAGAMGAVTFNAIFTLTGGALVTPANTKSRAITFGFSGTNWVERYRSAADF